MTEISKKTLRDSAGIRWLVLLLLASSMFCSYIFMDILSPIKDLMLSTRGWDSTAFGTMQGSETFLNVFVFFLIFAVRYGIDLCIVNAARKYNTLYISYSYATASCPIGCGLMCLTAVKHIVGYVRNIVKHDYSSLQKEVQA